MPVPSLHPFESPFTKHRKGVHCQHSDLSTHCFREYCDGLGMWREWKKITRSDVRGINSPPPPPPLPPPPPGPVGAVGVEEQQNNDIYSGLT